MGCDFRGRWLWVLGPVLLGPVPVLLVFLALPCLLFLAGLFPLVSFFGFLLSGLDPSQRVFFPLTWVLFLFPGVLWAFLDRIEDNGNFRHLRSD